MSAPQNVPFFWYRQSPKLGTDAEFTALRQLLTEADFTEKRVLDRIKSDNICNYSQPPAGGIPINDSLDALIALFFDCGFVEESKLTTLPIPLLDSLGLLVRDAAPEGTVYATAAILPAHGVWSLCDRGAAPDGQRNAYPPDVVYPPVFDTTNRFLAELPNTPCDAMLDLGTGAGIAALLAAPTAKHVWATDVTQRAVLFAEFNRRLNGMNNVTTVMGDLFAPVEGMTFDRIVIHPPYVPANIRRTDHVFAVSGDDGEQIIRRTVEGLPQYLRPGGRFYSLQMATDREDETFDQRVRKWLGESENQFDVMLAVHNRRDPLEYLASEQSRLLDESRNWLDLWERTKTKSMVYATLLIERHNQPRQALTRSAQRGAGYSGRALEWLLDWQKAIHRPDSVDMLLETHPLARPENELRVICRLRDGAFRREEFRLDIPGPFGLSLNCEEWLTQIIPQCDGVKTWRELFENAKRDGIIRDDVPIDEFAKGLGVLVSLGALQVPAWQA